MTLLRCAVLALLCMSLAGSVAGAGTGKPGPTLRPQPFVPTPGFGAQPQRLMLPFSGPVAIVATPSPERELRLWEGERLHRLDRRAFSEAMAALLRGSVEASGAAVVPQGKTIAVEVVALNDQLDVTHGVSASSVASLRPAAQAPSGPIVTPRDVGENVNSRGGRRWRRKPCPKAP